MESLTASCFLVQLLGDLADQMQSLGLPYRTSLVWMIHCSKTSVSDAQLAAFSKIGAAIAPEKVRTTVETQKHHAIWLKKSSAQLAAFLDAFSEHWRHHRIQKGVGYCLPPFCGWSSTRTRLKMWS